MRELRCDAKKHGELIGECSGTLEVKCDSRFCGKTPGIVVLHRFDLATAELVETNRYREIRSK